MTQIKRPHEFDNPFSKNFQPAINWDDAAHRAKIAWHASNNIRKKVEKGENPGYLGHLSKASESQIVKGSRIKKASAL